ncbi:hypothetical protein KCP91_06460 [Microvirga sp. SRT01]|jgi:hypothetical protein|uniref:Terminase small subunit n=1 Tax=Sphingomonas longa TaxID=2778730 RepID=A0ABS2D510_9SPHN|nr:MULTISPECIES: hypothetical protein [Alphaproteobacteria]MBM6576008.1 hypothetical protein [Sphingomonas sp. BT552]MBR7709054.1 hypothetical protein [Microvirga sp. SRT01]
MLEKLSRVVAVPGRRVDAARRLPQDDAMSDDDEHRSDPYERGRRDGLRLALAMLAAEEGKWAALVGESPSWRTNQTREVRRKMLEVAQKRIHTVLNRMTPSNGDSGDGEAISGELAAALDKIGL